MRRGRIFIYLALIVVLGVAAFFLISRNMAKKSGDQSNSQTTPGVQPTPTPANTIDVVVSSQDIPRGLPITEDHLGKRTIPLDMYDAGMYLYSDDPEKDQRNKIVGRIAVTTIKQNHIILTGDLIDQATIFEGRKEALLIPTEKVAVSIPINRLSSSAFAPQAGDHVNVIVTLLLIELDTDFQSQLPNHTAAVIAPGNSLLLYQTSTGEGQASNTSNLGADELLKNLTAEVASGGVIAAFGRTIQDPVLEQSFYLVPSEAQRPRLVSQTLLQDIVVLHVGNFAPQEVQVSVAPAAGAEGEPTATPTPVLAPTNPDIITLIVSPQDAVTLNYLIYSGAKLTLALRPPTDVSIKEIQSVTLDYLVNNYQITLPVKLNFGIEPRVDQLVQPVLINDVPTPTPGR